MTDAEWSKLCKAFELSYHGALDDALALAHVAVETVGVYTVITLKGVPAPPETLRFASVSETLESARAAFAKSRDAGNKTDFADTRHELEHCVKAIDAALPSLMEIAKTTGGDEYFAVTRDAILRARDALHRMAKRMDAVSELYEALARENPDAVRRHTPH